MVDIARSSPIRVFKVMDRDGRAIGQIMHPKVEPMVGRGAGTVLLMRDKRGDTTQPKAV
jgi:hypothetical protein